MPKFEQLPNGQILIIAKSPSPEIMAEIADRMGPTESAVEVDAVEVEAFLLDLHGDEENDE